jgi:hypothetical protein
MLHNFSFGAGGFSISFKMDFPYFGGLSVVFDDFQRMQWSHHNSHCLYEILRSFMVTGIV